MVRSSADTSLVISDARIVDVRAGRSGDPTNVRIDEGRITAIGPVDPADADDVVDAAGAYLTPGLIDAHVHLCWDAGPEPVASYTAATLRERLDQARTSAGRAASAGITTVRDLGGPVELLEDLKTWGDGADVVAAGPPVTRHDGHLAFFGGAVADASAARRAVDTASAAGARAIKIVLSGGGLTPGTDPARTELDASIARAATDAAHERGLRVAAHCHATSSVRMALDCRVDTIEHASMVSEDGKARFEPALADDLAAAGIAVTPTAIGALRTARRYREADGDPGRQGSVQRLEARAAFVGRWAEHGVRLIAGTDAGVTLTPFDSLLAELRVYAEAGLGAAGALRTATVDAADILGLDDRGEIREGLRADLLVLRDDPTSSLLALEAPGVVVAAGRIIQPDASRSDPSP